MLETAEDRGVTARIYGDTAAKQPTADLSISSHGDQQNQKGLVVDSHNTPESAERDFWYRPRSKRWSRT